MDHRRHQAQHAARALELHQRRPVVVEPVEHFGMNGVSGLETGFVIGLRTLRRKLLLLRAIKIMKRTGHGIARDELLPFDQRFEKSAPHDFESFFRARRPPRRLQTADHVT